MIIVTGIIVVLIIVIALLAHGISDYRTEKLKFSLKESMDLTGLPILTFYQNENKLNFILDTGSNASVIDEEVSKQLKTTHTNTKTNLTGIGGTSKSNNVVEIDFSYKDTKLTDLFQVVNMKDTFDAIKASTGVSAHGILGTEFLLKYECILDFENMIASAKKVK